MSHILWLIVLLRIFLAPIHSLILFKQKKAPSGKAKATKKPAGQSKFAEFRKKMLKEKEVHIKSATFANVNCIISFDP